MSVSQSLPPIPCPVLVARDQCTISSSYSTTGAVSSLLKSRTLLGLLLKTWWYFCRRRKQGRLTYAVCFAGFWGGLTPENAVNETKLSELLEAGVLGLKVSALGTLICISVLVSGLGSTSKLVSS